MKIGFYDSGLGGMSILHAVRELLPDYDYCYYADNKHLPLGDKTEAEVYTYVQDGVSRLFAENCKIVILACNTASSETLRTLQDTYLPVSYPDRRILGVIIPVIEEVVESTCTRIKLIGTSRTIRSGKYHLELGKRNIEAIKIEAIATPELVPLIEAGDRDALRSAVCSIGKLEADTPSFDGIILGCTHYTALKDLLRAFYGDSVTIFSQDEIIPKKLKSYLAQHPEIDSAITKNGSVRFIKNT